MSSKAGLSRANAPFSALVHHENALETGIVHLGLGNFHRAHLAIYTAKAVAASGGPWGIFTYSFRSKTLSDALIHQDYLYSVIDFAPNTEAVSIPAIHTGAAAGLDHVDQVIAQIAHASTKIISITVTEAGYSISQKTNGLDRDSADIQADLAGGAPKTLVGLLVRGLQARLKSNALPITIMSCDNLTSNGDRTRKQLSEFIDALPKSESVQLIEYLNNSVTFPNSMVDRIVPGTEERHLLLAEERLGVHDAIPVPAEPFSMWALEDKFIAGRPDWESAGVIFTEHVEQFEIMKLRLLNGAHSLLAYFGALHGCETIPDSRFTPIIEEALRSVLYTEYLPTLQMPQGLNADEYIAQLFSRWSNTVLADKTFRVGSDGSTKLPQRITEPVFYLREQGNGTQFLALTVAAWLACIAPINGFEPGSQARAMKDPAQSRLEEFAAQSQTPAELVELVFHRGNIFSPELGAIPEFLREISNYLGVILTQGIESAIHSALQSK